MFLAIIIPPAKKDKVIACCVAASFVLSWLMGIVPLFKNISSGNKVMILTILIATVAAIIKPVNEQPENKETVK